MSNATKRPWTRGPWAADPVTPGTYVWAGKPEDGAAVCLIRGWGHLTGGGGLGLSNEDAVSIQAANATLIAAAPDLYEALEALLSDDHIADEWMLCQSDAAPGDVAAVQARYHARIAIARSALAKANPGGAL